MSPKHPNLVTEVIQESKLISSPDRSESKSADELGHECRGDSSTSATATVEESNSGRERLKRHRVEVAGRVWIPELWGQEDFLKEWIDCTVFDAAVRNKGIMSARASLMEEGGRAHSRIQNPCSS